ncbi:acetate--CoA ligase family protein, partial [Klebsiella pneumoniae]|uniref:acetate--CoA ligase family protein n=1 Tax=Klebsiella pneumoniae TaxID=573 RepID=UPI003D2A4E0E
FYANQQLLLQTPPPMSTLAQPDVEAARLLIESVLAERRRTLTEMESKALLAAFHIPVTQTVLARSANEAMMLATQLGFPVALKIARIPCLISCPAALRLHGPKRQPDSSLSLRERARVRGSTAVLLFMLSVASA